MRHRVCARPRPHQRLSAALGESRTGAGLSYTGAVIAAGGPEPAGDLGAGRVREQRQRLLEHPARFNIVVPGGPDERAPAVRLKPRHEQVEISRSMLSPNAHPPPATGRSLRFGARR